jgi:hypothetical protein
MILATISIIGYIVLILGWLHGAGLDQEDQR